jgi:DNA-binding NtrC family response regulator
MNIDLKSFTPATLQCLMGYAWPGSNRQLENEIKRLNVFLRRTSIKEEHLDPTMRNLDSLTPTERESTAPARVPLPTTILPEAIDVLERRMIKKALRKSAGNKRKAPEVLG